MRKLRETLCAVMLAAVAVVAGCSDGSALDARVPDAGGATFDAAAPGVDGGVAATFGDQVKDLIVNQTSDTTPAVAVDFASADSEAAGQFDSLF